MFTRWYPCIIPTVVTTVIRHGWVRYLIGRDGSVLMIEYADNT